MAQLRQFYGGTGVPLRLDREPGAPAVACQSHRARLRTWLDGVADSEWGGPTRCALWDMTALVWHLVSGSQLFGYTVHKADRGIATEVLRGFDTQLTARTDAERFGVLTPGAARDSLASQGIANGISAALGLFESADPDGAYRARIDTERVTHLATLERLFTTCRYGAHPFWHDYRLFLGQHLAA